MARKKKLNIRVFKLRSGEELVAEIVGKVRGKITINRPMKIVTSLAVDPYTGSKRNMTYLHSWLGSSSDIKANLPIDFIVMDLPPDADVIVLYEKQMNMDDAATNSSPPPPAIPDAEMKKLSEGIYKDLEKLMKECDIPFPKREKTSESAPLVPYPFGEFGKIPFPPNRGKMPPVVQFTVAIPNEIMVDWIERGFIDYLKDCVSDFMSADFIDELMEAEEEFKKSKKRKTPKKQKPKEKTTKVEWVEPPETEKKSDQFGNDIKDWSPYLKDYIDEPPQDENKK